MFEDCIFKPIFRQFLAFISRLHIIKTTFRSPYTRYEIYLHRDTTEIYLKRELFTYYLFAVLLLFNFKTNGQSLVIDKLEDTYVLNAHLLDLAIDETATLSFDKIKANNSALNFKNLEDWTNKFQPQKIYWSKFQIENNLPNQQPNTEWVLKYSLTFTDLDVYVLDNEGIIQTYKSGFFTPLAARTFAPNIKANIVKLSLLPNKSYTVYTRMDCDRSAISPEFTLSITSAEKYLTDLGNHKERNALYFGFVLMMLIYNLFLYIFAKDKAFIFYTVYLLGLLVFVIYNSGSLADWFTGRLFPSKPELIHFFKLLFYVGMIGYWTFVRTFMNLSKVLPTWDSIFKWLALLAIPAMLLDAYLMSSTNFSYNISDRVSLSFAGLFCLSIFGSAIPLIKTKDKKAYFIVFGIITMGSGILLTIFSRLQSIDFSTLSLRIGSIFEIMAFSLGLAYRRLLEERERQQAHFQLVKTKLVQEQEQKEGERLKELDNLKSRLYTNITHEFRTPLTVIMGINERITNNDKAKDLIHRNSKNLLRLINQMLDLAKAEEGKLQLDLIQKDIVNYVRYLTESFLSAAETKNIKLTFYTEKPQLIIKYDEAKIQHIIQNLLSNAIKFTSDYGQIIIHVKTVEIKKQSFFQIKVEDSGIGIAQEEIPHIFDRFYQSDNTSTRKVEGTGIGLALTKELVNLMNGEILVESQLGKGSKFIVLLPYEKELSPVIVYNSIDMETELTYMPLTVSSPPKPNPITIEASNVVETINLEIDDKPLLLIIEDNEDVLTYIQLCLVEHYRIKVARNGIEGLEKAFELVPDIIISDVMIPEKDGFEVTQTLKQDKKTSHIPIILLTAKATHQNKLKGLKYGADAYLMKPFDKEELLIRLEKLVELRNRLQQYYAKGNFSEKENKAKIDNPESIFLKEVYQIINKHLIENDFSVPQIAQAMNMSQVQVYRKLKALTGKTPTQYIRSIRMEKAMTLLKTTTLNISEIAYDLGFSDPNYFSRTFQQVYGKTPSSIRK